MTRPWKTVAAGAGLSAAVWAPRVLASGDAGGHAQVYVLLGVWTLVLAVVAIVSVAVAIRRRRWRPLLYPAIFVLAEAVLCWLVVESESLWPEAVGRAFLGVGIAVPTVAAGIAWLLYRDFAKPAD